jgi:hypothetical protein
MIECVFTVDYEIYGNGEGSLRELVLEPAEKLKTIFQKHKARFVVFVEAAELEMIEFLNTDDALEQVKQQIRGFHRDRFELGLHLHPQWYNARYANGSWRLDYDDYNLCSLPRERIVEIVERSIRYLRRVLGINDFSPLSFRAGNWLFQPTQPAASVLAELGIKIDSSVFKGGIRHQHGLDYRPARRNGYFWPFSNDVNTADPQGTLIEFPTYTKMVPPWEILSFNRIGLETKSAAKSARLTDKIYRILDFLRLCHPMKLDFCRLTIKELVGMFEKEMEKDRKSPGLFRPIVAIGHTKELVDLKTVDLFLTYLDNSRVAITTFDDWLGKVHLSNMKARSKVKA